MTPEEQGQQLELFQLTGQTPPRPHREMLGRVMFHLRSDQLVLGGIGGLIAVAIVFAFGVERGKHLVRGERMILSRQHAAAPSAPIATVKTAATPEASAVAAPSQSPAVAAAPASPKTASKSTAKAGKPVDAKQKSPAASPKSKAKSKVASAAAGASKSRYAIQVVTYTQPSLAKKELERLQARGERGFLVMREGRTIVYVGPFPSKDNASAKLTNLRSTYQDCFMRTL